MKWRSLLFLFTCLLMQKLVSGQEKTAVFTLKQKLNDFEFSCKNGKWQIPADDTGVLKLYYKDEDSGDYQCEDTSTEGKFSKITVKFRTCDNCIELDTPALTAIIVGNILATFLIAFAVYSITAQPKGKNFSGNKASDKVNLITNGDRDTYQQLNPGQNSEYSRLEVRHK
ncbi:T-cell surface glycoprotein CD3 gamma chain [Ictalurus furcatus]|uniref:T-cell surface glycoprotein CD3 gamma chain n=1 Tax=Ictalurus furcatus TaxID=66913 RepID=UPI00234FF8AF|nr:T-cell surface glycoprotein CD3 gamma chain [Ictalurus furcatus]XP_053503570.1 T-cell surface glycoprotein CD3 gamma chain [Ictalurus furcatus]